MADPVVHITNGVPDSGTGNITTLGQVLAAIQSLAGALFAKITDGTNTAAVKPASTAPLATDPALVVALSPNSVNASVGNNADAVVATANTSAPVVNYSYGFNGTTWDRLQVDGSKNLKVAVAPSTTDVAVTPTVTASAYTANNCIGGIMTFASVLAATSFNGILQSITAKFKATAATGTINVHIFKASPSNGTYTDKTAVTWNAADMTNLLGTYQLTAPLSTLGTMTTYNLDGIGKALVGASTSLFVVATVAGTPTPASTADFTLELSVLPG